MLRGPTGTVFLARTDARGVNACPQSARVAKWQPQRTQNPPPSKGMKVRVLSRALAATIVGSVQRFRRYRVQRAQMTTPASADVSTSAKTSTDAHPRFESCSLYESPLPGIPTVPSTRSLRTLTVAPGRPADNEAPVFERLIRKNFPSGIILRKRKKPIEDDDRGPLRRPQAPAGRFSYDTLQRRTDLPSPAARTRVRPVHYQTHYEQDGRKPNLHQPSPTGPRWLSEPKGAEMRAERLKHSPSWINRDARLFHRRPP